MNARSHTDTQPWYRQPWPWLLMLGPMLVIVAGVYTAYLAVVSNDGLVDDDYYKQGLTVNQRTARDHRSGELGIEAEAVLGGSGDHIRVLLRANSGVRLPDSLILRIAHPTRAGFDQTIVLGSEGGGVYGGKMAPFAGRRHIALEDIKQEWRLLGDWVPEKQPSLRLHAFNNALAVSSGNSVNNGR